MTTKEAFWFGFACGALIVFVGLIALTIFNLI